MGSASEADIEAITVGKDEEVASGKVGKAGIEVAVEVKLVLFSFGKIKSGIDLQGP